MNAVLSARCQRPASWRSLFVVTLIVTSSFCFVIAVLSQLSLRIDRSGPAMCSYITDLHNYLICRGAAVPIDHMSVEMRKVNATS